METVKQIMQTISSSGYSSRWVAVCLAAASLVIPSSKASDSQAFSPGSAVRLSAHTRGENVQLQWLLNGSPIPGATDADLDLTDLQPADGGIYSVVAGNALGIIEETVANLRVAAGALPAADQFLNRGALSGLLGSASISTAGTSTEADERRIGGKRPQNTVWTSWTAPADGVATFTTDGSDYDTLVGVYIGSSFTDLIELVSDDDSGGFLTSKVQFNATAGTEYQIVVGSRSGKGGNLVLNWVLEKSRDLLPVITRLPEHTTLRVGDTLNLSIAYDDPPASLLRSARSTVQWLFNGQPIPGANNPTLQIRNFQEKFVGHYSARITSGNRSVTTEPTEVQINSEGLKVLARSKLVDAAENGISPSAARLGISGRGSMRLASRPVQKAATLWGGMGVQVFYTYGAGKDPDEPDHCGVVGGHSYWFSYQPPTSGLVRVNSNGSSFDTLLAVYYDNGSGQGYGSLVSVACDNNGGSDGQDSSLSFWASSSTVYYIVLDGVNGATGTAYLNYQLDGAPTVSSISNQTINEDSSTGSIGFTVSDDLTPPGSLSIGKSSSNPTLVPYSGISLGGGGTSRTVNVTPAANKYGNATITIMVSDSGGNTTYRYFSVTVNSVNDPPYAYGDYFSGSKTTPTYVSISSIVGNDTDPDANPLTLQSFSSTTSAGGSVYQNSNYLVYTPPGSQPGYDTFTYTINDGQGATSVGTVHLYLY